MIDFTSGDYNDTPTIRTPDIEVWVDYWDWETGKIESTVDITKFVVSYAAQKTIKTTMGGCTLTMTPLMIDENGKVRHAMDMFLPMDVIRIKEFGRLIFQGYVRRIGTNGMIGADGKPGRRVNLTLTHIGGLLAEAQVGFQLIALRIDDLNEKLGGYQGQAEKLAKTIADKVQDGGGQIGDIVNTVIDAWFDFLTAIGAQHYRTFLNHYIDFKTGVSSFDTIRVLPSDVTFFYSSMQNQTLWAEIQKMMEVPFNEFFFDEGPRDFWTGSKTIRLPEEKSYLCGRPTPYNESTRNGVDEDRFDAMPVVDIPLKRLTRFDFTRSMEECYSTYLAVPNYARLNEFTLFAMGAVEVDDVKLNKYLLRPLTAKLFYRTILDNKSTKLSEKMNTLQDECLDGAKTLKNWYSRNEEFINGNLSLMVPSEDDEVVRIGDKVSLDGIEGEFYVEGVAHQWTYGGALVCDTSVTRGYNYGADEPIKLEHAIFMGGSFRGDTK